MSCFVQGVVLEEHTLVWDGVTTWFGDPYSSHLFHPRIVGAPEVLSDRTGSQDREENEAECVKVLLSHARSGYLI